MANDDSTIAVDQLQVRLDRASVICERDRPCQPPVILGFARMGALKHIENLEANLSDLLEASALTRPSARY